MSREEALSEFDQIIEGLDDASRRAARIPSFMVNNFGIFLSIVNDRLKRVRSAL